MSASNPSPIVTEVVRFEDLPPGSRGTRRAIATGQELFFGCYADPDALPAIQQLPALIEAELHQLGRAPTQAPTSDTRVTAP